MRACVHAKKVNPGSPGPIFSKHSIFILDTGETQDIISCDERAGSRTGNSPIVSCEKECLGSSDESIYEEIVCCQLQTPCFSENKNTKNSYKIPKSAVSCTLLMSGFQIFAADAAFPNRAARDFFTHPAKKMPYHFQIFARKLGTHTHTLTQIHMHTQTHTHTNYGVATPKAKRQENDRVLLLRVFAVF